MRSLNPITKEHLSKFEKCRLTFLIVGITLCMITVILLGVSQFAKQTYVGIALSNIFIIPLIYGFACLIIVLITKREARWTSKAIFSKLLLGVLLILLLKNVAMQSIVIGVKDLQATLSEEYYYAEGVVQEVEIRRKSNAKLNNNRRKDTYILSFTLNNDARDTFTYHVDNRDDYRFEKGKRYKIVSLPHSKQILSYKE